MSGRALILGGGGVTGVAWSIGLLTGLAEADVDVRSADLIVGTSAGSSVAAQLTSGRPLDELYAAQLTANSAEIPANLSRLSLLRWAWAAVTTRSPEAFGARLGRAALRAQTISEEQRRAAIAARLPSTEWPERRLLVTAVDAESGEFRTFDRDSGVSLLDAVCASCAVPLVWPPVTIGGRRYIDGGIRSAANADLAEGYQQVLIVAPVSAGGGPITSPGKQAEQLRAQGARVELVSPDAAAKQAIGGNSLDPAARPPAARAGRAQAAAEAERIAALWTTA